MSAAAALARERLPVVEADAWASSGRRLLRILLVRDLFPTSDSEDRARRPFQVFRPVADEQPMTLDELDKLIREARSPQELFGDNLDAALRRFRACCHPDR